MKILARRTSSVISGVNVQEAKGDDDEGHTVIMTNPECFLFGFYMFL